MSINLKRIKYFFDKVIFIMLMFMIIAAIVLYREDYYDIIFIPDTHTAGIADIPSSPAGIAETEKDDADDYADSVRSSENISQITNPTVITETQTPETPAPTYAESISKIESAANYFASGWIVSDGAYNRSSYKIVKLNFVKVPNRYSYRDQAEIKKIYNDFDTAYEEITVTNPLPVIRPYMGYIMVNNQNGTTSLYDSKGKIIHSDLENLFPAYSRDEYGRPLFIYDNKYYTITINDKNQKLLSPVNPKTAFMPGLKGDYTEKYGAPNMGLYLYYTETNITVILNENKVDKANRNGLEPVEPIYADEKVNLYGYKFADGRIAIPAKYYYAYNFSDNGLAVVADRNRNVAVINANGTPVINSGTTPVQLPELNLRSVFDGYALPHEMSLEESQGMLYFDHSLLRIRRLMKDYYDPEISVKDNDILIKADGAQFNIPAGYTLIAYADGVLKLKKGEYYGYLDYTGKWIAQPIYTYAGNFCEGLAVVGTIGAAGANGANGKKGVIDTKGNIILPFIFDEITNMSSGVIAAYEKNNGWTIFNKITKEG